LAGMLLADLYMLKHRPLLNNRLGFVLGILIFVGSPFIISVNLFSLFILKFALFICAFYLVLFNERLKHHFSKPISYACRGYVLFHLFITHFNYIRIVQRFKTMGHPWGHSRYYFYTAIAIAAVLIISAIFYKLVEQPCMRKVVAQKATLQITGTSHRNQNFLKN
jgi:peptidoglycan/LPS O-acetylase OafA/YrhL